METMSYFQLIKREFTGYSLVKFRQDVLAGLTVGAVALPLALAFGVASGADAAAGLVTAILAGLLIGLLSGAPYQISGPTGAMSAVLILAAQKYGLEGVWVIGVFAGVLILFIGIFRLGRFIAYIPAPVITGFTSGIAVIIFVGQIDNFLGIKTPGAESTALKILGYFQGGFVPDWRVVLVGMVVVLTMIFWPQKWGKFLPGSLAGIVLATVVTVVSGWDVPAIGSIPRSILLDARLTFDRIPWQELPEFFAPAVSIAALGAVESLLCGAVAAKMTGIRLHANQELIAQGLGNILIPFFGGVPATAAIARTSVGIKSGGQTRVVSLVHSGLLLASALVLAPVIARVPLAALAGVLMVTAYRMNEWAAIRFMFSRRFKTGILTFGLTLAATVALDLTQAILIGVMISSALFINRVAQISITVQKVDPGKMRARGFDIRGNCPHVEVAYLTGPLFFAATGHFNEAFAHLDDTHVLILSMRAVPLIDVSGIEALTGLYEKMEHEGKILMLSGVQPGVMDMLNRAGLVAHIGEDRIFWSSEQAIVEAENRTCPYCQAKPH
ncbi:MAG: SulP family inorganic anion transporter [Anaerolineales bacterium]